MSDHSPWEVMSLINMQCERILHSGEPQEEASVTTVVYDHVLPSAVAPLPVILDDSGPPEGMDCINNTVTVCSPIVCTTGDSPPASRGEMGKLGGVSDCSPGSPGTKSPVVNCGYNTEAVMGDSGSAVVRDKDSGVTFCLAVDGFPVSEESRTVTCDPVKEDTTLKENCPEAEDELSFKHPSASVDHLFGQPLDRNIATVDETARCLDNMTHKLPGPEELNLNMTLDFNSNICFTLDPEKDKPPFPNSPPNTLLILTTELGSVNTNSKSIQDVNFTEPQEEHPQSCMDTEDKTNIVPPAPQSLSEPPPRATKVTRKQRNPSRSADARDPGFQGVTFSMQTELDDSREKCRLLITSRKYSQQRSRGRPRGSLKAGRSRSSQSSLRTSSSEEESDPSSLPRNKICASCCTKKTPLWRDAEDGTPLCNACGIRYKKYRVRCLQCWHIPRKEGNTDSRCFKCGDLLRLAPSNRKPPRLAAEAAP
ncbi:GATA-type zinc finger protein 1 isoform X2 [Esox lucius]|nr:GATA-type zinc finger protein 1 isoform X2 [Esox lucius]